MKKNQSVKTELKQDIDRSFEKLIQECSLKDLSKTIKDAKITIADQLEGELSDPIKQGLKKGLVLIELIENARKEFSKKIGLAALEYLLDPWDVIPDLISDEGFLDDVYVINKAIKLINEEETQRENQVEEQIGSTKQIEEKWVILEIGAAAGPHLAKRAKELDILNGYQRRALFDIGRKQLYGYELTKKQYSFFETLIEELIKAGLLEYKCPDSPCDYCTKLKSIYRVDK